MLGSLVTRSVLQESATAATTGAAALTGAGSMAADGIHIGIASATLTGAGSATVAGVLVVVGAAALGSTSLMDAEGEVVSGQIVIFPPMPSATLANVLKSFPVGTTVGAYLLSQQRSNAAPDGTAVVTAVVAADRSLTFTGLAPGVVYVAYASVGGNHRYIRFRPAPAMAGQLWVPGNGIAETMPRRNAGANVAALTSGTLYLVGGIVLPKDQEAMFVGIVSGTTAGSGLTHSFALLADQDLKVLAASADVTTATLAANTGKEFTLATPYTPADDAAVYVGVCFVHSGGAVPTLQGAAINNAAVASLLPKLCGASNTGLSAPPAVGSTLAAITATALCAYAYVR